MPSILLDIEKHVARITFNRPQKLNACNREMALLLQDILDECAENDQVRALYITGSGRAFCTGQDLVDTHSDYKAIISEQYNPLIKKIRQIEKPVVCGINGAAVGAGANIALCCDIVVAAESAYFIQGFIKIGLIPDSGGTFVIPRLIGFQKASAMFMLGDKITAAEAERMGMIYKILPDENFAEESLQIAIKLSKMPTKSLAYTKQALNNSLDNSLEEQLFIEDQLQLAALQTDDFVEGVNAFREKRLPVFRGR